MPGKYVVQGCSLQTTGSNANNGTAEITTAPSTTLTVDNNGVYVGTIAVLVSGVVDGTYSQTAPVSGTFNNSAQYNTMDNQKVLLDVDTASVSGIILQNSSSPFDTKSTSVTVIITDAGQTSTEEI